MPESVQSFSLIFNPGILPPWFTNEKITRDVKQQGNVTLFSNELTHKRCDLVRSLVRFLKENRCCFREKTEKASTWNEALPESLEGVLFYVLFFPKKNPGFPRSSDGN